MASFIGVTDAPHYFASPVAVLDDPFEGAAHIVQVGCFVAKEASIKVEMEDICDWPTAITIYVRPDGDSWKVVVMQEGSVDDADRRQMIEEIAARLKAG